MIEDTEIEAIKKITKKASMRIARFSFDFALKHQKKNVTAVHKANVTKLTDGFFLNCHRNIYQNFYQNQGFFTFYFILFFVFFVCFDGLTYSDTCLHAHTNKGYNTMSNWQTVCYINYA